MDKYVLDAKAVRSLKDMMRTVRRIKGRQFSTGPSKSKKLVATRNSFWARITALGPNGEADTDNCQYWLREIVLSPESDDYTSMLAFDYPPAGEGRWLSATCIEEVVDEGENNTHILPTDDTVVVRVFTVMAANGSNRYLFHVPAIVVD